jgi:DeoR family transcriptional regulator, suf operon transcriptional repressor
MVDAPAPTYSSAKRTILLLLKRAPDSSLAEVAGSLGISKVAALAHVRRLESDGLVARAYRAGRVGRPRVVFRLTEAAVALFPHNYAEMSRCALEFIEERLGRPAVGELLARQAAEVADRNRTRVGEGPLAHRVAELAKVRAEGGYMAEVGRRQGATIEMLEHNCPILALAERFPEACEVERRMFESMLRARVDVSHRVVAGDPVCRFIMREGDRRA